MSIAQLKPLRDQTIVVTGASSGIGLATAQRAALAGARVMLVARNPEALTAVQRRIDAGGGDVAIYVADVGEPDAAERIAAATIERFGGFDTWINNAAAATYGTILETPLADQRRVFDVGYWGLVNGSRTAAAHLAEKGGAIINIGSVLSDRAMILQGPYSAMKHAVKGFTDTLRMELAEAERPISVTLIKPSAMHTPYPLHARNRMRRPAKLPPIIYDPRLVARAILFAASHQRREIVVGGFGLGAAWGNRLFPGLLDKAMVAVGRRVQQTDILPPQGSTDNLWEARADGAIESQQPQMVRRQSLWLEAQLRPGLAVAGVLGMAIAAGLAIRQQSKR
jgi:NAD(P)-dependent dehydrogenase (short-subunit alcohol dehydrogenase family)